MLVLVPAHTGSATQNTPSAPSTVTGLLPAGHWLAGTGSGAWGWAVAADPVGALPGLQPKTPEATLPQYEPERRPV